MSNVKDKHLRYIVSKKSTNCYRPIMNTSSNVQEGSHDHFNSTAIPGTSNSSINFQQSQQLLGPINYRVDVDLDDTKIATMDLKDLNKHLKEKGVTKKENKALYKEIKKRRRTLRNRGMEYNFDFSFSIINCYFHTFSQF